MPNYTGNPYNLAKPIVGVDEDWGVNGWAAPGDTAFGLNDNFQLINYHMFSRRDGGSIDGDTSVNGNFSVSGDLDLGGDVTGGNLTVNRYGEGVAAYINASADTGFQRGLRVNLDGGTTYAMIAGADTDGSARFGSASFQVSKYIANSSGRHDFYCGTGNLDATISSNGFYMRGDSGLATQGKLTVNASITPDTLVVSGGIILGHGGSNGYLDNTEGGSFQFRWSGATQASITAGGNFSTSGTITASAGGSLTAPAIVLGAYSAQTGFDTTSGGYLRVAGEGTEMMRFQMPSSGDTGVLFPRDGTLSAPIIRLGSTYAAGFYLDTAGRLNIKGNDGAASAQFELPGTALNANHSVVTREKGDARYVQAGTNLAVLGFARVNSGGALARSDGIITSVDKGAIGVYTVNFTSRNNPVIFITPINSSNRTSAIITAQGSNSCTIRFETGGGSSVDCAFNFMVM